ncbi:cupin domain-containing protein [Psychrobacillus sp.]|uniref:cupin domain-containing protein n=1 Tax=Psychrobacillus sp. TaxID=1871623 RepID=UPI0028BD1523|nr:cupin domain-containing protein [Psychrobacillus sp.]
MDSSIDYTSPSTEFTFDVNNNTLFKKDVFNFLNVLGVQQLNTLNNTSLIDIFLSANNVIEPHYHPNASELVYCISGAMTASLLNPFTKQYQTYSITPGQVVNIPQGWWHYQFATVDQTHVLAIFNAPTPEVILGSDILTLTPSNIMAHTYSMDKGQWEKAIAPIIPSTYIGPRQNNKTTDENKPQQYVDDMNHYEGREYIN